MEMREFGNTGLRVSALGYGAAPAGYLDVGSDRVRRLIDVLAQAGVNVIDVAECYPNVEAMIGEVLHGRRDDWVIITKCGHAVQGDTEPDWSPQLLRSSIDRSLRRLRTECIDVMLLHSCSIDVLKRGDVIRELVNARRAGKIRHIGYSGDNDAAAYAAERDEFDVLEVSINICDQHNIDHVLPKAMERNLGVIAKRPLANAAWKPLTSQPGLYAEYAATYTERFTRMNIDAQRLEVQGEPNQLWSEIALRFSAFTPGVHTCVVGSTNEANLVTNVKTISKGPLNQAINQALRDSFINAERRSSEHWLGQT